MTKSYEKIAHTENGEMFKVLERITLLPLLYKIYSNRSRNSVKSILARGQVFVNDRQTTQFNDPLKARDQVFVMDNRTAEGRSRLIGLDILYEDRHLIVVNKAAGLLSISTGKDDELTVFSQLNDYVRHKYRRGRVYIVHRLDRDTSGVMLIAKSSEAQNKLRTNWQRLMKKRQYVALVEGRVEKQTGTIKSYLKEGDNYKMYSVPENQGGKRAITDYKVRKAGKRFSLVELSLKTGRKNQIRVHMQDVGHTVVGDWKYGSTKNPLKRLGLHSEKIIFIHPITDQLMEIKATAPKQMLKFVSE